MAAEPILRRLSEPELAIVEAADLFNTSAFRRTIHGVARSLGEPQVSIMPLSGVSGEMAITVAWEISWYQYRVSPDAAQPVRLAEGALRRNGYEPTYILSGGGADANIFNTRGLSCLNLSNGMR